MKLSSFFSALLLLFATGCSSAGSRVLELSEKDSGRTLDLDEGDTVRVVLTSNPTTGFMWNQDGVPDSDVIRLMSSKFLQKPGTERMTGAPGTQEFLYKVVGPGDTGVRLKYCRSWEKKKPESVFQLRVIVKQDTSFLDRLDRSKTPLKRVDSKGRVVEIQE